MSDDPRPLVVYDGSRRVFRAVADRLVRGSGVRAVPWGEDAVQAFLDAQFGGRPFAFLFVDGGRVHAGAAAVALLSDRLGAGGPLSRLLERLYPAVAAPFGRVVHGQEPADISGSFPLDDRARGHLAPLRRARDVPVTAE